jgi:hypothetical protein
MKHHFGDMLDREGGYWTVVPNVERYAHGIGEVPAGRADVTIATIGSKDESWRNVFTFPALEELTLHEPSQEQLAALAELPNLKRLRITHARPKNIEFLRGLTNVEELVLEYVSGFSDLTPLRSLTRLRALHLENLRAVRNFGGLSGITSLKYLHVDGTLDWKQPIEDFEFLRGLLNLEVLSFGQVINHTQFPAMLPALTLQKLKRLRLTWNMLPTAEYALLEVGLRGVPGADWGPFTRFKYSEGVEWFEFTGKGAGRAKCGHVDAERKCAEFAQKYALLKQNAADLVATLA